MTPRPDSSEFVHWRRIPTRWSDHDMLGHVNNARFYTFDEDARLSYFEPLWKDDPKFWTDYGFILASLGCDFLAQLHHPAEVDVGFRISRLGRSSMGTLAGMFDGGRLVAVTCGVVVWYSYREQKPLPLPDHLRQMILARERVAPET
jgi:acyl-CoA thioester hydrolase